MKTTATRYSPELRERAVAIGGRLHIDSKPGTGTIITITVPLEGADQNA